MNLIVLTSSHKIFLLEISWLALVAHVHKFSCFILQSIPIWFVDGIQTRCGMARKDSFWQSTDFFNHKTSDAECLQMLQSEYLDYWVPNCINLPLIIWFDFVFINSLITSPMHGQSEQAELSKLDKEYKILHSMHQALTRVKVEIFGCSEVLASNYVTDCYETRQFLKPDNVPAASGPVVFDADVDQSQKTFPNHGRDVYNYHCRNIELKGGEIGLSLSMCTSINVHPVDHIPTPQQQMPLRLSGLESSCIDPTASSKPSLDPSLWSTKNKLYDVIQAMDRNMVKRKMARKHYIASMAALMPLVVRVKACLLLYPYAPSDDDLMLAILSDVSSS